MIKRYSRKELTDIWSEENKYKIWLDVEIAAAQAMEKLNQIPKGVSSIVRKKARINVKRIHQIESQVKHDVIAFLTSVTEKAGIKARYLHQGMTSSDVLDTSFNIQLVQSGKIILKDLDQILKPGKKLGDIGHEIQTYVEEKGFSVVRDFCGHGIGTTFHEPPNILHYGTKNTGMELNPGMTFTIEPMINAGKFATKMLNEGWTAVTKDKSLSAQFEHTVGITENGYEIFTESAKGYSKPPYL